MIGAAEPRPFASLSSGLLARKGQAKPAMRPQGFGGFGNMTMGHEDLGWNDMGYDAPPPAAEPAAEAPTPAPRPVDPAAFAETPTPPPAVHAQFEALEAEFGEDGPEEAPRPLLQAKPRTIRLKAEAPVVAAAEPDPEPEPPVAPARSGGRKAAFTLRLDADRHLRLRLASAVQNRSAQLLVTEALDRFLDSLPGLKGETRN